MEDAGLEAGLGEGIAGEVVIAPGAFEDDDQVTEPVVAHRLADLSDRAF
jgi:hypothetical protein